jgi:hypothetical protein
MRITAASVTLLAVAALTELCMAIPAARDDTSTPTGKFATWAVFCDSMT